MLAEAIAATLWTLPDAVTPQAHDPHQRGSDLWAWIWRNAGPLMRPWTHQALAMSALVWGATPASETEVAFRRSLEVTRPRSNARGSAPTPGAAAKPSMLGLQQELGATRWRAPIRAQRREGGSRIWALAHFLQCASEISETLHDSALPDTPLQAPRECA